jgi:hypothetical protein
MQEGKNKQVVLSVARVFVNKIANKLKTVPYCMLDIVKGSGGLIITLEPDAQKQLFMRISLFAKVIYPLPSPKGSNTTTYYIITTDDLVIA